MEQARAALLANADIDGLRELLELARAIRTLAPADTKTRERLLAATEEGIESLAPGTVAELAGTPSERTPSVEPQAPFTPYGLISTEQIFAPARAEIERQKIGRSLRLLEKARRKLLARADVDGLGELIELAQRLPVAKPRHGRLQKRLIDAAQQNVRYLGRRKAIKTGETWSDPFAAARPKTKLPSLPPMTRRDKLIAVAIVVALAAAITALALLDRAPQRAAHAIKCPTGEQGSPTWSPDGKEIAFAKNRECGTQITVVSAEGGPLRTVSKGYGVLPDWSPDGSTILYRSRDGFSVVPVQGGKSRLLRSDDGDMGASWSPDGTRIAFVHGLIPYQDVGAGGFYYSTMYTMNPDGSDVHRLLGHSCNPGTPAWSPDGGRLAFSCKNGIYVMRLTTRNLVRAENWDYSSPVTTSWSPDGRQIAIGYGSIEIMNANGSGNMRSIHEWDSVTDVAWSPDGRRLAFVIAGWGPRVNGLYVIDRDGSHRRRLVRF
ncbi:MAG: hypothetical protein ABSB96_02030 [Gaiellaceae bacterium]